MDKWTITVARIGTKPVEIVEKVEFQARDQIAAERKLGDVWNGEYSTQPGRFRAKLRNPAGGIVMTID